MATEARSQSEPTLATGADRVDRPEQEPPRPWPVYLVAGLQVGFAGLVVWSPFRHDGPVDAVKANLIIQVATDDSPKKLPAKFETRMTALGKAIAATAT